MSNKALTTFCECNQYCLASKCVSSDSNLSVRKCWCAQCKEIRADFRAARKAVKVGA